jgi:hypothetical protein
MRPERSTTVDSKLWVITSRLACTVTGAENVLPPSSERTKRMSPMCGKATGFV